jgi:hypothetical protein
MFVVSSVVLSTWFGLISMVIAVGIVGSMLNVLGGVVCVFPASSVILMIIWWGPSGNSSD